MKKNVNQLASNLTKSSNSENWKRSLENSRRLSLIIRLIIVSFLDLYSGAADERSGNTELAAFPMPVPKVRQWSAISFMQPY